MVNHSIYRVRAFSAFLPPLIIHLKPLGRERSHNPAEKWESEDGSFRSSGDCARFSSFSRSAVRIGGDLCVSKGRSPLMTLMASQRRGHMPNGSQSSAFSRRKRQIKEE